VKSGWIKSPNCTRLHTGLCRPVVRSGPASHDNAKGALCYCDILVTDGFVLTEMAAVSDALRITNRVNATPLFSWTFRSAQGGPVASPSGATVMTEPFSDKARPEYVFAIGNAAANAPALSMGPTIRRYVHSGAQVFLMAEAASRHLKERGGEANGLVTHWENAVVLRERLELFGTGSALASRDGQVVTCAGMGATLDVVLSVIGRHVPSATLMTVRSIFLHEQIRDFSTRQTAEGATSGATGDANLKRAVAIMQNRIEDPIPIGDLVKTLGISSRSLERKFRAHLGTTPKTYYRQLRLTRANNLLLNTSMSVQEVGLATGFSGGLTPIYKQFFGATPLEMRRRRRKAEI